MNIHLVVFKVMFGSSLHYRFSRKYDCQNGNAVMAHYQPNFLHIFHLLYHRNVTSWKFKFWNLKQNEKSWNVTLWPIEKWKIANILETANRRAKWTKMWNSGVLVQHIVWGYLRPWSAEGQFGVIRNGWSSETAGGRVKPGIIWARRN